LGLEINYALNTVLDATHGGPDDGNGSGDPKSGDAIYDRPLADGPPPPERVELPDYTGPEDLRELKERIRAASDADAKGRSRR